MTDRVRYLTVILDQEYRTDDAEAFVHAISMVKGVQKVELGEPMGANDYISRQVIGAEIYRAVTDAVKDVVFSERK